MKEKEQRIHDSIVSYCKDLENRDIMNGEAIADEITVLISIGLLAPVQRNLYDTLTLKYETTTQIAKRMEMPTSSVSAQLMQIANNTSLICTEMKGEVRYWKKNHLI